MSCEGCKLSAAIRIPRRQESFLARVTTERIQRDVIFGLVLEGRVGFPDGVVEGKGILDRKRILTKALKLLSRIMNNPD